MPEPNVEYAVLSVADYNALSTIGGEFLTELLSFYTGPVAGYYYAVNTDALYEMFWSAEGVEYFDYYRGAYYMNSTEWVTSV